MNSFFRFFFRPPQGPTSIFLIRLAAVPLLIVILTAIVTTKIPALSRANQGFWYMVSDARTDFAMLCSLIFLIVTAVGGCSLDAHRRF